MNRSKLYRELSTLFAVLSLITLLPAPFIEKTCLIGYKAVCPFAPVSSLILAALAVFFSRRMRK